jgi:hypothetical protein
MALRLAASDLHRSFPEIAHTLGNVSEWPALERLHSGLPSMDYSRQVLTTQPHRLGSRRIRWPSVRAQPLRFSRP